MSTIAAIMALYKRKAFKGFLSYGSFSNVSNYIMIIGILLCVAIGYGENEGVEAALLAPTAINQQKFYFEYVAPDKVWPSKGTSLAGYTKIDLGIAMYNFEVGAGLQNFRWIDSPL